MASAIVGALARVFGRGALTRTLARSRLAGSFARNGVLRNAAARTVRPRFTLNRVLIPRNLNKNLIRVRLNTGKIAKAGQQFPSNWPLGYKNSGFNTKAALRDARTRGLMTDADYSFLRQNQGQNPSAAKYFDIRSGTGAGYGIRPNDFPIERPVTQSRPLYNRLRNMLDTFKNTPNSAKGPAGRRIREFLDRGPIRNLTLPENMRNIPSNMQSYFRNLYGRLRSWYRNLRPTPKVGLKSSPYIKGRYRGFYPGERTGPLYEPLSDRPTRFQTREQIRQSAKPSVLLPTERYDLFKNTSNNIPKRISDADVLELNRNNAPNLPRRSRIPRIQETSFSETNNARANKAPKINEGAGTSALGIPRSRIPRSVPLNEYRGRIIPDEDLYDRDPPRKPLLQRLKDGGRKLNQKVKVTASYMKPTKAPTKAITAAYQKPTKASSVKAKTKQPKVKESRRGRNTSKDLSRVFLYPGIYSKKNN